MAGTEVQITEQRPGEQEARYKHLDQLNRELELTGTNLENKGKEEEKKKEILAFCKEETEKTLYNQDLQEIGGWLNKIADTCVDREARGRVWFKYSQQVYWNLEEFLDNKKKKKVELQIDDMVNDSKPPDDAINVLFTIFILLGENQSELSTWQKIWAKLNQTTVNQLFERLVKFDDSRLTKERVDLADKRLEKRSGRFHNDKFYEALYSWCTNRIKGFRSREQKETV